MPAVSRFSGLVVFLNARQPPHFHTTYGADEVPVEIRGGAVTEHGQSAHSCLRVGRSNRDLAREFETTESSICAWVEHADTSPGALVTEAERDELERLCKEVRRFQQERDILVETAA